MRLVLMGAPGAGKGTLANMLKDSLKIPHISTGDILREEMKKGSSLGLKARSFIESGSLVPDEVVTQLVEKRLNGEGLENGFMLDGFPRTRHQAEDLDKILARTGQPLDGALYLECTLPVLIQRLTGRRICRSCGAVFHVKNRPSRKDKICDHCGGELYQRADDNEETIKTRMDVYLKNTLPIVDYYEQKEKLKKLDGDREAEDLQKQILTAFNEEGIFN